MTTKKVDLCVYIDGRRQVIGEAVVEITDDGEFIDVTGHVTNPDYKHLIVGNSASISLSAPMFKAKIPSPTGRQEV